MKKITPVSKKIRFMAVTDTQYICFGLGETVIEAQKNAYNHYVKKFGRLGVEKAEDLNVHEVNPNTLSTDESL